jgi:protein subunit release factor A
MQKAANLLLAGLDAKTIRQEMHEFLADRKGNGSEGERSDQTRTFVVNNLMKSVSLVGLLGNGCVR